LEPIERNMIELSLTYNYQKAFSDPEKAPIVLMLHGYGSHENDLYSLKDYLGTEAHYLSVRAPLNLGFGGFAWYPIHFDEGGAKTSDTSKAAESRDLIVSFISEFRATYDLKDNPIWLLGFSQGAILSYSLALNYPNKFSKVMALSGYVLKEIVPSEYKPTDLRSLDFFISHGTQDEVIPVQAARSTIGFLEQLDVKHRYQEYPEGHGINQENLRDLQKWFSQKA
jgi:phospholipase/carboxylesterase